MKEPSVLDYLKARLNPKKYGEIDVPSVPDSGQTNQGADVASSASPTGSNAPQPASVPSALPWRVVLALTFALAAQRVLEPPRTDPIASAWLGGVLFFVAAVFAVWSWRMDELRLASPAHPIKKFDLLTFRAWAVAVTAILMLAAFFFLGSNPLFNWDNLFTPFNVVLWFGTVMAFVAAFWLREPNPDVRSIWQRLRDKFVDRSFWGWALILLLAAGIVAAYRFYDLSGVLAEPFSDHAEKLFDVYDVLHGQTYIFFIRNTGREFFQMYLTAVVSVVFGTGLTFMSLKIGTALAGLVTLPYIYLIGREYGGRRVALFALLLAGMAYWPNVISRMGLRYPLYPLFAAPALYHLLRGLRTSNRNDFILSGLFLGMGLHGYSSFRFVPVVVVIVFIIYILHVRSIERRSQAVWWLMLTSMASVMVFLPLLRYMLEHPAEVSYRALTRLTSAESTLPGSAWQIFVDNFWKSLVMFQWSDGEIWVHSVPGRPALDVVSGALLVLGVVLVLARYIRRRDWRDLTLLIAVPLLTMPSTLSLAFPNENPSLNRSSGAIIPVFVLSALALDAVVTGIGSGLNRRRAQVVGWSLALFLLVWSGVQNFDLVFNQFNQQYRAGIWNSSEMGDVVRRFAETYDTIDTVWIVPYPYWVDTRLISSQSGFFEHDFTLWPEQIADTVELTGPKLFLVYPDDEQTVNILKAFYPDGVLQSYTSNYPGKNFFMYSVPPQ